MSGTFTDAADPTARGAGRRGEAGGDGPRFAASDLLRAVGVPGPIRGAVFGGPIPW
jgi:hypothetical protein